MMIRRLVGILGGLALAVPAGAQVVTPDINGDCEVDSGDLGVLLAQWGSCSTPCSADLDGDQDVDGGDMGVLMALYSADCPSFEFHWNVTGSQASSISLDTPLDAVTLRDVKIFYEQFYGNFPSGGLHLTFGAGGDYSNWAAFHANFLADHADKIEDFLTDSPPTGAGLTSSYDGYAVIDYESWTPNWEKASSQMKSDWKVCIQDINRPAWDSAFLSTVGYTPPLGTSGYQNLSSGQKEAFAKLCWNFFAKELFEESLEDGRAVLPSATWGYYGYPTAAYWDNGSIGYPQSLKDLNDEISWLFDDVDVLLPSLYQIYQPVTGTPGSWQISAANNAKYIQQNVAEARRLRDTYASGNRILVYVSGFYDSDPAGAYFHTPLNLIGSDQAVRMPRYCGADGVIVWGYVTCTTFGGSCDDLSECADEWSDEMNDVWQDTVLDTVADCS